MRFWILKDGFVRGHDHNTGGNIINEVWFLNSDQEFHMDSFPLSCQNCYRKTTPSSEQAYHSAHVLVVLRLIWDKCRKHMHKFVDLIFDIPAGSGYIWTQ